MSEKLKPCPFCGGEAKIIWELDGFETVECIKCGAVVDGWGVWNNRAERTCRMTKEQDPDFPDVWWNCSNCHAGVWLEVHVRDLPNYCPNCGAKVVE